VQEWIDKIEASQDLETLERVRVAIFGKKGALAGAFAQMKRLPPEQKPEMAKSLNDWKKRLLNRPSESLNCANAWLKTLRMTCAAPMVCRKSWKTEFAAFC